MPRVAVGPNDVWGAALNADLDSIEATAVAALAASSTSVQTVVEAFDMKVLPFTDPNMPRPVTLAEMPNVRFDWEGPGSTPPLNMALGDRWTQA